MGLMPFSVEHLIQKPQAIELTKPFWPEMLSVWVSAWDEYAKVSEEHRAMLSHTAFVPPMLVFGFTQFFAKQTLTGREAEGLVLCTGLHGVVGFYINEKILFKFNSVDEDGVVRHCTNSEHKESYFRQESLFDLNNEATRLTVGCVSNPTKTGIASILISCQVGEDLYYSFPIDGGDEAVLPIPSPTTAPSPMGIAEELTKKKPK